MATPTAQLGLSREAIEAVIAGSPYNRVVPVSLTHYEPGSVTIELPIEPRLTQHHGFVHGSIIGFLVDSACAWAVASIVGDVVTSEYKLNFLAPAVGDLLVTRGTVIKIGARQGVSRADVFARRDGTEKIVATALATLARTSRA
jgi:uncharacterized protein (TIGR00369 family)